MLFYFKIISIIINSSAEIKI